MCVKMNDAYMTLLFPEILVLGLGWRKSKSTREPDWQWSTKQDGHCDLSLPTLAEHPYWKRKGEE